MTEGRKRKRWDAILDRIPDDVPFTFVEVGVDRAITSRIVIASRPKLTAFLVDPYKAGVPGTPWWKSGSVMPSRPQAMFDAAKRRAHEVIAPYRKQATFYEMPSVEAAAMLTGNLFDMVFIDGDHSYEGCLLDIQTWLPLVKPGGWICGHDYDKPERGQVTEAVLAVFPEGVEVDAESTWFKKI